MLHLVLPLFLTFAANGPLLEQELIFPQIEKHSHGSSIVETANGDLLACWFHGSGERKEDDVLIQGARKRKDGKWSEPFLMADSQDLPDCNPVLFIDPRGTLWLFWIAVQNNEWGGALLKYRTAASYEKDGPPEWQWQDVIHCRPQKLEEKFKGALTEALTKYSTLLDARPEMKKQMETYRDKDIDKLTQRLGWMTRLHPIMLSDTRMMLGLYSDVFNCSIATFTEDWGKTWTFSEPIISAELGNIQPAFVKKADGHVAAFMRDNGMPKRIRYAESADNGVTWTPPTPTDIVNPGSSVECIALKNGHWVLICNDTDGRHILSVYLSEDEGKTWKWRNRLENFPKDKGSGSYPSLIQAKDGTLHCTYSYNESSVKGETIRHAHFNEEWIRAGQEMPAAAAK